MTRAVNSIERTVVRATQKTARSIHWLRAHIYSEVPQGVSAVRLAAVRGC